MARETAFARFLAEYIARTQFTAADVAFFTRTSTKTVYAWLHGAGPDQDVKAAFYERLLRKREAAFLALRDHVIEISEKENLRH